MNEDSVLLIDKPAGMTSFGVVARIRRILSRDLGKKVKVGHCGTLDPFATGLMIIVTGKECKNAGRYSKLDKSYETTIILGKTSTTGDPEGELDTVSSKEPTSTEIATALDKFRGVITQKPPIFSAIKVDGKRAYKLAREGKAVDIPDRQVTIHSLELIDYRYPELRLRAHVSSGTYIRSLAEDIGKELGVGGYCSELRRTSIGERSLSAAQTLADFGIEN